MKYISLNIPDVYLMEPKVHYDERGFFYESFNQKDFDQGIGRKINFVQDNHSKSSKNVLRGLHYQIQKSQTKLIRVIQGSVLDVAVDIRKSSPTFGQYITEELSSENKKQLWIPEGFAHGYLGLSEKVELLYKTTEFWEPNFERIIRWNDPDIGINWPNHIEPVLSKRDLFSKLLVDAEVFI